MDDLLLLEWDLEVCGFQEICPFHLNCQIYCHNVVQNVLLLSFVVFVESAISNLCFSFAFLVSLLRSLIRYINVYHLEVFFICLIYLFSSFLFFCFFQAEYFLWFDFISFVDLLAVTLFCYFSGCFTVALTYHVCLETGLHTLHLV